MKGFLSYSFWNTCNRVLTAIRTVLFVNIIGRSSVAADFSVAERAVAVFRKSIIDGTFHSIFMKYYFTAQDKPNFVASTLVEGTITYGFLTIIYIALILGLKLFGRYLLNLPVIGYFSTKLAHINPSAFDKMLYLSPLIILGFWVCIFSAILDANEEFGRSAINPLAGNLLNTFSLILFAWRPLQNPTLAIAAGHILYSVIQICLAYPRCKNYIGNSFITLPAGFITELLRGFFVQSFAPISDFIVSLICRSMGQNVSALIEYSGKNVHNIFHLLVSPLIASATPILSSIKNELDFMERARQILVVNHILAAFATALLFVLPSLGKNFNLSLDMCTALTYAIPSLYLSMQYKVLNTIALCKQARTPVGSIVYAIVNLLLAIGFSDYRGIIMASNMAILAQIFVLLYDFNLNINFSQKELLAILASTIASMGTYAIIHYLAIFISGLTIYSFLAIIIPVSLVLCISYIYLFWNYLQILFNNENNK